MAPNPSTPGATGTGANYRSWLFAGLAVAAVAGIGYATYFDYRRRNDKTFRKALQKERKKAAKKDQQKRSAAAGGAGADSTTSSRSGAGDADGADASPEALEKRVKELLAQIAKDELPTTPEGLEQMFTENLTRGEQLMQLGPDAFDVAALCYYRALRVFPNPIELITVYQRTLPDPVFQLVMLLMSEQIKMRQMQYWEKFPPKEMNVRVDTINVAERPGVNASTVSLGGRTATRRAVIALKDFQPGDVVYVDEPVVSALEPGLETTHCEHCFKVVAVSGSSEELVDGAIACPTCPYAKYCSKECEKIAFDDYHQHICPGLHKSIAAKLELFHQMAYGDGIIEVDETGKEITSDSEDAAAVDAVEASSSKVESETDEEGIDVITRSEAGDLEQSASKAEMLDGVESITSETAADVEEEGEQEQEQKQKQEQEQKQDQQEEEKQPATTENGRDPEDTVVVPQPEEKTDAAEESAADADVAEQPATSAEEEEEAAEKKEAEDKPTSPVIVSSDHLTLVPLMILKFIGRMIAREKGKKDIDEDADGDKAKTAATAAAPADDDNSEDSSKDAGDDETFTTWEHIERIKYLDMDATQQWLACRKLTSELLDAPDFNFNETFNMERYMMLVGKIAYNAYAVNIQPLGAVPHATKDQARTDGSFKPAGMALYFLSSQLQHSCKPNTKPAFPTGTNKLALTATEAIKEGDELTVSWIPVPESVAKEARQKTLVENYGYRCACDRCSESEDDDDE
ncbi:SET domain-containing protein [Ramicandelaber brevisporus]|nr:SET domain-containing protein [Ramicandelaber brevisporus]